MVENNSNKGISKIEKKVIGAVVGGAIVLSGLGYVGYNFVKSKIDEYKSQQETERATERMIYSEFLLRLGK